MYRAMEEARAEGKIRSLGISNFSAAEMEAFIQETGEVPAVNQAEAHVFYPHRTLAAACAARGIFMQAWSPLAEGQHGLFTNETLTAIGRRLGKRPRRSPSGISSSWASRSSPKRPGRHI